MTRATSMVPAVSPIQAAESQPSEAVPLWMAHRIMVFQLISSQSVTPLVRSPKARTSQTRIYSRCTTESLEQTMEYKAKTVMQLVDRVISLETSKLCKSHLLNCRVRSFTIQPLTSKSVTAQLYATSLVSPRERNTSKLSCQPASLTLKIQSRMMPSPC